MPVKKEQIALRTEITNQEQWDDIMAIEGIVVVDVYQKWCGPCAAVISLFRRIKNELGDDLLKLAVAESDNIDSLEAYRGLCEPCFLFFAGGQLVHVVRGANGPALYKGVQQQLAAEHKVLEEGAERKMIIDPLLARVEAEERAKSQAEMAEKKKAEEEAMKPVAKEVTIVLIKPDAVQSGKVAEILEKLNESGFDVLANEEKTLTEEEVREFYKEQEGEEHFEDLVTFMSSGPSHILVLTKGDTGAGVIHEVRDLLGPKDISLAKEEAPESLRALFGTDTTMNALHGADSKERAARELTFFFPNFTVPIVPGTGPPPQVEKTLALIRPEALREHKDAIMDKIHEAGFEVCLQKEVQLTEEQAMSFYSEQEGQPHYDALIAEMTKGPVLALGLAREEAIQGWRTLLGPTEVEKAKEEAPDCLRAQFSIPDVSINALHGSDSTKSATKELEFFFPKEHTLAVIKPDAADEHKDAIVERIKEAGFNIACEKHIKLTRDLAAKLYQEHEGKEFYEGLLDHMTSGKSTVMILSREDAVHGLRTLMGPTDPERAREEAPESFRALLGKDVLTNAIHGSSTMDQAIEKIPHFFPEVIIKEDGSIETADGETDGADGVAEEDAAKVAECGAEVAIKGAEEAEGAAEGTDEGAEEGAATEEVPAAEGDGETKADEAGDEGEKQPDEPEGEPAAAEEGEEQKADESAEGKTEEEPAGNGEEKAGDGEEKAGDGEEKAEDGTAEVQQGAGEGEEKSADEGKEGEAKQDGEAKPEEQNEEAAKGEDAPETEEAAKAEGEEKPDDAGGTEEAKEEPAEDAPPAE